MSIVCLYLTETLIHMHAVMHLLESGTGAGTFVCSRFEKRTMHVHSIHIDIRVVLTQLITRLVNLRKFDSCLQDSDIRKKL